MKEKKEELEIIKLIKEDVYSYFPNIFNLEDYLTITIKKRVLQSYSNFYKIIVANRDIQKYIWVKVKKNHPIEALKEGTQEQYDELVKLWEGFKSVSPYFRIPRPLNCYPDSFAYVIEDLPGEKLNTYIRFGNPFFSHSKKALLKIMRMCGEWLGFFHTLSPITERKLDIKKTLLSEIKRCIDLGLTPTIGEKISLKLFNNLDKYLSKDNQSMVHNDYTPNNIIINKELSQIGVIDIVSITQGSIYYDLSFFLAWIESLSFPYTQNLTQLLKQAFLEGYCNYKNIDFEHLDFFMIISVVHYIAELPRSTFMERSLFNKRINFFFKYLEKAI